MRILDSRRLRPGPRIAGMLLIVPMAIVPACDTQELLEVRVPGRVPEEALSNPELAETLVASVQADFECAWDNYVGGAAVHSDEFIPTSANLINQQWGARQMTSENANFAQGDCDSNGYPFYTPLQTARFQAEDVYKRLASFAAGDVPNKASFQARVRTYGAYALVALAEGFCEMALDGGPLKTPDQVLAVAEQRFTEGIELARQVDDRDILSMGFVGRARVRLDLENFEGAIKDAVRVPTGYVKNATRDASDDSRFNTHYELVMSRKHASVSNHYRNLEWMGVTDPRVNVDTKGELGFDTATPFYFHDKVTSRETPVLIASYKEAQLIIAEAAARTGDLDRARRIINERHALAGLPDYDQAGTATQTEIITHAIEERRRELFVEGGHRLNDMLRFRGTKFEIPFLGEPGSIHPNGLTQTGLPYGEVTCFPLPDVERFGNPNIGG